MIFVRGLRVFLGIFEFYFESFWTVITLIGIALLRLLLHPYPSSFVVYIHFSFHVNVSLVFIFFIVYVYLICDSWINFCFHLFFILIQYALLAFVLSYLYFMFLLRE